MESTNEEPRVCSGRFGCGEEKSAAEFFKGDRTCKKCRLIRTKGTLLGTVERVRFSKRQRAALLPATRTIYDTPRGDYALMTYDGVPVAFDLDLLFVCLNDIYSAAGSPPNQTPPDWKETNTARALIAEYLRENPNMESTGVWITRSGQHGGTWARKEIALAYAQYLSPALYLACNRFVLNRSDQFLSTAPSSLSNEALDLMNRIMDQNAAIITSQNAMLATLGRLPRIDQNTTSTAATLAGVESISVKQTIRCQVYIFRLLPESPFHQILLTILRAPLKPGEDIVGVGRTGPDGDVHDLRIKDYFGKLPFLPLNYERLCVIETDREASEGIVLKNPVEGGRRLILTTGKYSQTFLAATKEATMVYRGMRSGYYTYETLRSLLINGLQLRIF